MECESRTATNRLSRHRPDVRAGLRNAIANKVGKIAGRNQATLEDGQPFGAGASKRLAGLINSGDVKHRRLALGRDG
jgi:hypothetical protein